MVIAMLDNKLWSMNQIHLQNITTYLEQNYLYWLEVLASVGDPSQLNISKISRLINQHGGKFDE